MNGFKVPFAHNSKGTPLSPKEAERGEAYFCPSCKEKVIFRMGKKVRPHFAHGHSANCSQESIIHATAKSVIVAEIGKEPRKICFVRSCPKCGSKKEQPIPEKIITAEEEVTSGPFRVDIGLFSKEGLEAAIECPKNHIGVQHCPNHCLNKSNDLLIPDSDYHWML